MAARTGVGVTALQHLKFAAEQTGASMADVETALRNMARKGLDARRFEEIGARIAAIADPSKRAAAAMEAFGKSGTKLLPMLADFNSLKAASIALGPLLTEEEIKRADDLGDAIDALAEAYDRMKHKAAASSGFVGGLVRVLTGAMVELGEDFSGKTRKEMGIRDAGDPAMAITEMLHRLWTKGGAAQDATAGASKAKADATTMEADATERATAAEKALTAARKIAEEGAKRRAAAWEKREGLIKEFRTPHEEFKAKEFEILKALDALIAVKRGGTFDPRLITNQAAELREALSRLRIGEGARMAEEAERAMRERMERVKADVAKAATEIQTSARGTFSAAGAGMLGRGGASLDLQESKKQTDLLRQIKRDTGRFAAPRFT